MTNKPLDYYIECDNCGIRTGLHANKEEALKTWNNRAATSQRAELAKCFCGSIPSVHINNDRNDSEAIRGDYYILCAHCGRKTIRCCCPDSAIRLWNIGIENDIGRIKHETSSN